MLVNATVFACLSKVCAPPPVGRGGSTKMSGASYRAARGILSRVSDIERPTTSLIRSVVNGEGGSMVGLKHRVKTLYSLARKIHNESVRRNQKVEFTATKIPDGLRYTAVFSDRSYSQGVRKTLRALKKEGYEIDDLSTHWKRGDAYNGVHAILRHPKNGTLIEVQFHTPSSHRAKVRTHAMYKQMKDPKTSPAQRKSLIEEMVRIADSAEVPSGAMRFGYQSFLPADQ